MSKQELVGAIRRKEVNIINLVCHMCAFKKYDFECPVCNGSVQYRVVLRAAR